jgi:hypothetical protein
MRTFPAQFDDSQGFTPLLQWVAELACGARLAAMAALSQR